MLPQRLDENQGVDFTLEKALLVDFEDWAAVHGWSVSDGSQLPHELSQKTDVLLDQQQGKRVRIAVLPKSKGSPGTIRVDATPSFRSFELVYQPRKKRWRVEVAAVPVIDDIAQEGWDRLEDFAFRP